MKTKITFLSVFSVLISLIAQAQPLKKNYEIIISGGLAATDIKNSNIKDDKYKVIDKKNGYSCSISFNKYFNNRTGIGIGLGASNYKQTDYQKGLFESGYLVDQDGYGYNAWVSSDMTYTYNITYLDVPITLHLLLGHSNQFYGFIDVGIVNGFLISGKYTEKGSIETMSKYADPNGNPYFSIITQNNPYYDVKYQTYDKSYSKNYATYNISGRASFGFVAALSEKATLRVEPFVNMGLRDITSETNQGKEYVAALGESKGYTPTKTFSYGLSAGFGFNF